MKKINSFLFVSLLVMMMLLTACKSEDTSPKACYDACHKTYQQCMDKIGASNVRDEMDACWDAEISCKLKCP